ncbi:MAG: SURF1 family protein [Microvirga sp.]
MLGNDASGRAATAQSLRRLILPALAALIGFAVLVSLGTWQLQRRAWKLDLIERIEARAYATPGALPPESEWAAWSPQAQEYRRVRVTGRFLYDKEAPVHGLLPGPQPGQPIQGFYLLTPLELRDGSVVIVNRGFVPTELRDPGRRPGSDPAGEVTFTGLMRAPEKRGWFVPENDPARNVWFTRDADEIARAKGLARVAPFLIDAGAGPDAGGWPRGGQTRLSIPNDHLQYALTWFGLALTLAGVFGAFAWRRRRPGELVPSPPEP